MASRDLGKLGAKEGPSATYRWPLSLHLLPLAAYLVLCPLFFIRSNRDRRAWAVLIPIGCVLLCGYGLSQPLRTSDYSLSVFLSSLSKFLGLGLGALWLLLPFVTGKGRIASFFAALFPLAVVAIATALDWERWLFVMGLQVTVGCCLLTAILAPSLAASRCRKTYGAGRFVAWLLLFCLAVASAYGLVAGTVIRAWFGRPPPFTWQAVQRLLSCLLPGAVLGLVQWVALLPFVLLAHKNSLYRARFFAALRLSDPITT